MYAHLVFLCLFGLTFCLTESAFKFEKLKNGGQHWALLVAGSYGYSNYRHQADICHAYQILHKNGIPDDHIVVMMYDDIAKSPENPVKGNIINQPNGPNVYKGVLKDYTGMEVNPTVFLSVLKGESDKVNGKKVINSGPNDNVFVNFVDHGASGFIAFGNKMLKAQQLNNAILYMHQNKKYNKMVFYVEACEAGSMFHNLLPNNISVFATTAANPTESSYACYFDQKRQTYLGDVYSIKWMQDSDKEDLTKETLQKQFEVTKAKTSTSHVMEYGNLTIGQMTVAEFQGMQNASDRSLSAADPCVNPVKSEDVPLEILRRRLDLVESKDEAMQIEMKIARLLKERETVDRTMKKIVGSVSDHHDLATTIMEARHYITKWDCYESAVTVVEEKCKSCLNIPVNDYALRKLYMFVNMCELNVPSEIIHSAIEKVCFEESQ